MPSLADFLRDHKALSKSAATHSRIPDKDKNISGGSYTILPSDKVTFYDLYHAQVFVRGTPEYLTEFQPEVGPLAIDIDFRYKTEARHYTMTHVHSLVHLVINELENFFESIDPFPVYVFEKPTFVTVEKQVKVRGEMETKIEIKDGMHLLFGARMDRTCKQMMRDRILHRLPDVWADLQPHLSNSWDSVVDNGVLLGTTGWQLYGSRKPGLAAYKLTQLFEVEQSDGMLDAVSKSLDAFRLEENLPMISVQHPFDVLVLKEEHKEAHAALQRPLVSPPLKPTLPADVNSREALDACLEAFFLKHAGVPKLKELHDYVMSLPEPYWGDNSYEKWVRVGWALKNTDAGFFPTWVKFSSQSPEFSFDKVAEMKAQWDEWKAKREMLTERSIMYWARNENPTRYEEIRLSTLDGAVEAIIALPKPLETDYANLLHYMFKDRFVFTQYRTKTWYEYKDHRWRLTEEGHSLRMLIDSKEGAYQLFQNKYMEKTREAGLIDQVMQPEKHDQLRKQVKHIGDIMIDLKRTDKKGNIMKEAQGMFYDSNFMQRLDSKSHLMCFNNGVVDLKSPEVFRPGVPEDYTSKCTNIDYVPLQECDPAVADEVRTFMRQLFPIEDLYEYMWDHAASALWGKNTNQTFNVYTGVGRNGKSAFVQLMGKALGDYKATVPVTLITQKRTSIGSCSPEIAQLVGVRYAVMQEPSLGDKINEGIMKELTGGDPLQARALYQSPVTFQPQFLLACCTNNNFEILSTDDGTWRRMRIVDFLSLFCENPVEGDPVKPYQFKVDKNVEAKFEAWKSVFMALLVERAVKTRGDVVDCPYIVSRTREYREDQDFFAEYTNACIVADPTKMLKKTDNEERFEEWWRKKNKDAKKPNSNYLKRYMDGRFGSLVDYGGVKKSAWQGVTLLPEA